MGLKTKIRLKSYLFFYSMLKYSRRKLPVTPPPWRATSECPSMTSRWASPLKSSRLARMCFKSFSVQPGGVGWGYMFYISNDCICWPIFTSDTIIWPTFKSKWWTKITRGFIPSVSEYHWDLSVNYHTSGYEVPYHCVENDVKMIQKVIRWPLHTSIQYDPFTPALRTM